MNGENVKPMQKGDVVGKCRYCGKPLRYAGTGRRPKVCPRSKCRAAYSTARGQKFRKERSR